MHKYQQDPREPRPEDRAFVTALSRRLLADEHASEDVAQDTWLAYLEVRDRVRSLRGFLATVARGRAVNRVTAEGRRRSREREIALRRRVAPATDEVIARRSVERMLLGALEALDEPYRSTLRLRFYEDLPPMEIARVLGVPRETVRTRLRRGLALLREDLDRRSGGERSIWTRALLPFAGSSARWGALGGLGWLVGGAAALVLAIAVSRHLAPPGEAPGEAPGEPPVAGPVAANVGQVDGARPGDGRPVAEPAQASELVPAYDELELRVVLEQDGRGLPGVLTSVRWADGQTAVRTGSDGRVRARVPRGTSLHITAGATVATDSRSIALLEGDLAARGTGELVLAVSSTRSIAGRVLDQAGRPLQGVELGLWDSAAIADVSLREPELRDRTDAQGRYAFHGTPPTFLVTTPPGRPELSGAHERVLPVALGLAMPPLDYQQDLRMEPGASLTGFVLDAHGEALAGARVRALGAREELASRHRGQGLSLDSPRPSVSTDDQGAFRIAALPVGDWRLVVTAPGKAPLTHVVRIPSPEDVVLRMSAGRSLVVSVVDARGAPLPGATVALQASIPAQQLGRTDQAHGEVARRRTDAAGKLTFDGLADGAGALVVLEQGGRPFALRSTKIGEPGGGLQLRQPDARPVTGHVRASGGLAIAEARVDLVLATEGGARAAERFPARAKLSTVDSVRTDPSGAFSFDSVPATPLTVRVVSDAGRAIHTFALGAEDDELDLVLSEELEGVVVFTGQVRDALSGEPLARSVVSFEGAGGQQRVLQRTGEDGRYRVQLAGPREVWLVAKAPQRAATLARPAIGSRRVITRDFLIYPETDLQVRVVDRAGAPIPLATIEARDAQGEQVVFPVRRNERSTRLVTDRRGEALLLEVPRGAVHLEVRTPFTRCAQVFEVDTALQGGATFEARLEHVDLQDSRRPVTIQVVGAGADPPGWSAGPAPFAAEPVAPPGGWLEIAVRDAEGRWRLELAVDPSRPERCPSERREVVRLISRVGVEGPEGRLYHEAEDAVVAMPARPGRGAPGGAELFPGETPLEQLPFPRSACQVIATLRDGSLWTRALEAGSEPLVLTLRLPSE